ncbi:MAG: FtsW/RodA/SpoVE family cell cycle protein [Streptococcus salivarius]
MPQQEQKLGKHWISHPFQPSEFMKISYILFLSRIGVWAKQGKEVTNFRMTGYCSSNMLQSRSLFEFTSSSRDMGTALVFLAILAGIVVVSGISWRIILPVVLAFATGLALFVMIFTTDWGKEAMLKMGVQTYQITSISAWLDPFTYADGIAFQQTQGMISIGTEESR